MKPKSKAILITGVSSGIGYGITKELINRNYTVFGSVRKPDDAQRLKTELGENFFPLVFDVTDQLSIERAAEEVKVHLKGTGLCGLINNAGISVAGPVEHLAIDKVEYNFNVNVLGIFRVTKTFLPLLGTQRDYPTHPGRILNISSISGKISAPYLASYSGTKYAVEGISHCLRKELIPFGIDVVIIGPGQVQTPIWDKGSLDEFKDTSYISSMMKFFTYLVTKGKKGMALDECSRRIANIFETEKPKTRYAIVQNKFQDWILPLLLPDRVLDRLYVKKLM
ncbi:MAG TPA: SDR family oxidoreductase [Parachlamydiaceae bacterium]|nr:SDR family oxidoreductase [Parachlamydiaceae bacterium]